MVGNVLVGTYAILCFGGNANGGWNLVGPIEIAGSELP